MNGKVLSFYLDGNLFGLDIMAVKEIDRHVECTPVPGAPSHIVGLFNMRGQVVTLFDLNSLLGYERKVLPDLLSCIILKNQTNDGDFAGFIIDRPGEVIDVHEVMCEHPPANLSDSETKLLIMVIKFEEELLRLINHDVIFEY